MRESSIFAAASVAVSAFVLPAAAPAMAAPDFAGKTIEVLIDSRPGGGTDGIGRMVGGAIAKYLPGAPATVMRNMPAGGGLQARNYFYEKVKPDGMTMLASSGSAVFPDNVRRKTVRYDARQFVMIGGLPAPGSLMIVRKDAADRLIEKGAAPLRFAGANGTRSSNQMAVWGPAVLDWNIRWVVGYQSNPAMMLSLEQGETQAWVTYDGFALTELKESGNYIFPAQIGMPQGGRFVAREDFADVPVFSDLVKPKLSGKMLKAFEAWEAQVQVGKWYGLPPKAPDDIAAAYRTAFGKAMKDETFIGQAKKAWSPVYSVASAAEMSHVVDKLYETSDEDITTLLELRYKVGIPKGAKRLARVRSDITAVGDGGGKVTFTNRKKPETVTVSGSGTDVTIKGKAAARGDLRPGMKCEFFYTTDKKAASSIAC